MDQIHLSVNDQPVTTSKGDTILAAASQAGITIPFLCWQPGQKTHGNCGLCVVQIEGTDRLSPACSTLASEGMVIRTETEDILEMRRNVIEIMFGDDVHDCGSCHRNGNCTLQNFLNRYHLSKPNLEEIFTALGL
ncbi:2Fe-2S iron-sulfur cluster-binding protein [Acidaminobacter sp.]|uniref:2Fe-2S iron-sulfur cluster-binding protein n=1 Tax=Acidaminobacter sp. TaxID=1872102 RepID=UPI00137D80B7|nr:2Fe-2S iron-sulfur cluster-binding protein [Acidaminobacter sp.]MDK9711917.1 2Fe-2S iron-sulfur cluster-binding protein [Acidaminobacter sp.]MZQ97314.1 2Fe-2S iron-sulfur cluster binding domain-containing protein [Acidaminobacter sp.]